MYAFSTSNGRCFFRKDLISLWMAYVQLTKQAQQQNNSHQHRMRGKKVQNSFSHPLSFPHIYKTQLNSIWEFLFCFKTTHNDIWNMSKTQTFSCGLHFENNNQQNCEKVHRKINNRKECVRRKFSQRDWNEKLCVSDF